MKQRRGILVFAIGMVLGLAGGALFFLSRPPVLIITDAPFMAMHGPRRMLWRQVRASLLLYRPVAPVMIGEGAAPDVLAFAVDDAVSRMLFSRRPYCVLFPYRYADGARRYRELFPETPAALLQGRYENDGVPAGLSVFSIDMERDFRRAGLFAAAFGRGKMGNIVLFQAGPNQTAAQAAFQDGLRQGGYTAEPLFFNDFSELPISTDIACVVLAGSGAEYLNQNFSCPAILFTWLDPDQTARETALIFDDSIWALTVPLVKAVAEKRSGGRIPSEALIFSARIADKDILRQIQKAAGNSK
jgi:hypothetical protein